MVLGLDTQRRPAVFVKATLDEPNSLALRLLEELSKINPGIVFPRVVDVFAVDKWWITVEEPLPQRPHKPAHLDVSRLHELVAMVQGLIPSKDGMVCAHGDFGPWNVRQFSGRLLGILDWEYAHWSPRAADELWYLLTYRLATSRTAGEKAGASARQQLRTVYTDEEIGKAAEFIVDRRSGPEPAEIREGVARSASLIEFEDRLAEAFSVLTG